MTAAPVHGEVVTLAVAEQFDPAHMDGDLPATCDWGGCDNWTAVARWSPAVVRYLAACWSCAYGPHEHAWHDDGERR
jgi:hypothetical protein